MTDSKRPALAGHRLFIAGSVAALAFAAFTWWATERANEIRQADNDVYNTALLQGRDAVQALAEFHRNVKFLEDAGVR